MSKKTRRSHKKYRTHKKHRANRRSHTRKYLYRKRRQILTLPGSKGLPLFSVPEKNNVEKILVNQGNKFSGNMILGLRNI